MGVIHVPCQLWYDTHNFCDDCIRDRVIGDVLQSSVRGEMEAAHLFALVVSERAQASGAELPASTLEVHAWRGVTGSAQARRLSCLEQRLGIPRGRAS